MDLSKINAALKCEIFDTQYQLSILQDKMKPLYEKLGKLLEVVNKQMASEKENSVKEETKD